MLRLLRFLASVCFNIVVVSCFCRFVLLLYVFVLVSLFVVVAYCVHCCCFFYECYCLSFVFAVSWRCSLRLSGVWRCCLLVVVCLLSCCRCCLSSLFVVDACCY